ncbi:MAG: DNA adenine methylase [Tissierellia bacterium]|nr:DNA adenine methylase [Tissierellia bacterium]
MDKKIYPFVKWAGGKRQLLPIINENLPSELLSGKITKYIEPFVGGGAVLFDLIQKFEFEQIVINDFNLDLINLYKAIKYDVDTLINKLEIIVEEYLNLDTDMRAEYYYNIRKLFNNTPSGSIDKSVYLLFLNKTCFNGLYRVNSKNEFNVPHGKYKNPTILDKDNLISVSNALSNVDILQGDFTNVRDFVDEKTFVYFDPPYRPLNSTSNFTSYSDNDFNDDEQIRLANFFNELNEKNAKLMLSNSDPKNIDENDEFFDKLYSKYNIMRVHAKRVINSKSSGRGIITELLIINY